jgi:hypothetical protein
MQGTQEEEGMHLLPLRSESCVALGQRHCQRRRLLLRLLLLRVLWRDAWRQLDV